MDAVSGPLITATHKWAKYGHTSCIPASLTRSALQVWLGIYVCTTAAEEARPKRVREETADGDASMEVEATATNQPAPTTTTAEQQADAQVAKQAKSDAAGTSGKGSTPAPTAPAAPAVDTKGDCIAYIYDQSDNLMLHDVVEVVGVVSKVPELAAWHMEAQARMDAAGNVNGSGADPNGPGASNPMADEMLAEQLASHPPTSQVLRVHAVLVARKPALQLPTPASPSEVGALRSAALDLLKLALGGDALAAEYVLLTTLGRVTSRSLGQGVMGISALNLTKCPPVPEAPPAAGSQAPTLAGSSFGQALHKALVTLLPAAAYLPLSVDACNSGAWAPKRDYETNKLSR